MGPVFEPAPSLPMEEVAELVREHYGLAGELQPLPGERDENLRLETPAGDRYVVKVANRADTSEFLDLVDRVMTRLADRWKGGRSPRPIAARDGRTTCPVRSGSGEVVRLRVLSFLEGQPLASAGPLGRGALERLGRALGELDACLADLDDPAADRELPWDLGRAIWIASHTGRIRDARRRRVIDRLLIQYRGRVMPGLPGLPRSIIHGDANDENLLQAGEPGTERGIGGLLDFGDLVRSHTVNELAIASAYLLFGAREPVDVIASMAAGYHGARPLIDAEIAVLFPLVAMRLCVSLTMSAIAAAEDPENEHRQISDRKAWEALQLLAEIDWEAAEGAIRAACGRPPRSRPPAPPPDLLDRRRRSVGPSLSLAYRSPLTITGGRGTFLLEPGGRALLDCVNNIAHVGHGHPRIVQALATQAAALNTNTRYLHPLLVEYAERLAATLPDPLGVCYFVNSGSEANELAVRLARAHTGRDDVLVIDGAYHGNTTTLVDLSPYKCEGPGGRGLAPWAHKVPAPDPYRGAHRGPDATGYATEVGRKCAELVSAGRPPGLFLCEPILGCGGQVVPPPGYLQEAFRHVRQAGGICAVDEVQVGLGRVGERMWAFELQDVVPDIVTLGKPMGNGHPIGAVITTPEIAESFANGMEFFSSFGGNPVSMAVGLAVLDVIEEERLQEHAARVGRHLLDGLRDLAGRHPLIGDVRGAGLFLGVELVRDRGSREPATAKTGELLERLKEDGILLSADGPHHNVLKIKPPMPFAEPDADLLLCALSRALAVPSNPGAVAGVR